MIGVRLLGLVRPEDWVMHSCNISMQRLVQGLNCFREIEVDVLIKNADLVITGEGHSDRQTLMGKLPQRILEHVTNQKYG